MSDFDGGWEDVSGPEKWRLVFDEDDPAIVKPSWSGKEVVVPMSSEKGAPGYRLMPKFAYSESDVFRVHVTVANPPDFFFDSFIDVGTNSVEVDGPGEYVVVGSGLHEHGGSVDGTIGIQITYGWDALSVGHRITKIEREVPPLCTPRWMNRINARERC